MQSSTFLENPQNAIFYLHCYRTHLIIRALFKLTVKRTMQADIHPTYANVKVTCSCGNSFETKSTLAKDLNIEVCSKCHPFFTGQQKIVDTAGQVDKFRRRYKK